MALVDFLGRAIPEDGLIIRHTEVGDFRSCRRRWWFTSHNGLNYTPRVKDAKLSFGSAWHTGLEMLYKAVMAKPDMSIEDRVTVLRSGIALGVAHESLEIHNALGEAMYDSELVAERTKSTTLLYALAEAYVPWAVEVAYPSDKELEVLRVEHRFLLPVGKPETTKTWLAAKLDTIVQWRNLLYIMEHKSASISTRVDDPQFLPLDIQMSLQFYGLLLLTLLSSHTQAVGGGLYNMTRKVNPGGRATAPIFGRNPVDRSLKEIAIIEADLLNDAKEMREAALEPSKRFHNPQIWGGFCTWGCRFRSACEAMQRGENVEQLLEA
jgi:CRISPR/Cas system-associated exonuclease Cas4 (RecB family)